MALTEVLRSDTFEQWRTKTNTVSSDLGDRATLSANITANTSLVGAINELQSDIGVIGSLSTFAASNVVAALNELKTGSSVTISGTKTFSSNLNLSSGQAYTIDGTSVLNATTLGSGVVNSSLTTVGTIGTGTWQGTIISPTYGGTGINNGSRTLTISTGNLTLQTAVGGSSLLLPASGTVATLDGNETLTTKTINLANNTLTGTLAQFNTALSDDNFAAVDAAQTLTNKTIALGSNTISGTLAQFNTALSDDNFAAVDTAQTLTNKSLQDSTTFFIDETTPTKRLQFQLSGISTNTTRTLTIPDNSGTIALTSDTTFIGTTSISLSRGSGNLALAGISSVTLPGSSSGTVVLQPVAVAGTTTITLPATSGTVVTTGDTGTVTNTMLAGSIANGKLTNSSVTFNGVTVALGASGTITSTTTNTLTIGDGLSGTSFNGSAAVTISADATIARAAAVHYIGTTSVALNRTSGSLALTGISSIDFPTTGTNVIKLTPASTNALVTLTMPAQTGTIVTTGDTGTVTNAMLAGSIANTKLTNSSVTIGTTAISLGTPSTTLAGLTSVTSTSFVGPLTGNVTGNLTGNADTATKLATARTINGVSFDGTTNITVTAAAGTLSGTALNSTVVSSSLTSLGTIGTGVWQGTSISTAYTDAKIISVAGTTNHVNVSNTSGAITLSLPQPIHNAANPSFASVTANNVVLGSAANTISTATASTNLTLTSTGGTVAVTGNETVSGTLDVSGKTQVVTSLGNNTVVLAVVNNNSTYTNSFPTAQQGANRFTVGADGSVEVKGDLTVRGTTTITGNATISANFNTLINKPSPVVGVTLSGDLSGSASTTLTELGAGTYTIALASTIADNAVIASKIAADAVTTAKILNGNVTNAKLQNSSLSVNPGTGMSGGGSVSLGGSITLNNTDGGSLQNIFKNIAATGSTTLTAGSNNDTLNFASDGTLSITLTATGVGGVNKTVNITHATMGSQASVDNSGGTVIQDVTLNNGHVTGLTSVNLDTRYTPINTETLDSVTTRGGVTANSITVGGLTVTGTLTYVNSTNLEVTDKNILIGKGSNTEALLNGSGITFGELASNTPSLSYSYTASPLLSKFVFNRNVEAVSYIRTGGTNAQFLKADGSVDSTSYQPAGNYQPAGTYVTSVGGSAPVASSGGTTPQISLNAGYGDTQNPYASKTQKFVLAAPNGADGVPTFRALLASDIPPLSYQPVGTYVTSVGASAPVASSGGSTPTISLNTAYGDTQNPYGTKNANTVLAGPPSGAAATPTFRALVAADIPPLSYQPVGSYLTAESDTLQSVTSRTGGATTTVPITVASPFTITKSSNTARISFPVSGGNDPGYIEHDESTNNTGIMRFSAGDDSTGDYFVFGYHTTSFQEGFKISPTGTVQSGSWQGSLITRTYTEAKLKSVASTGNSIAVSDISGDINLDLPTQAGITGGSTYNNVTVNSRGVVTGGSNVSYQAAFGAQTAGSFYAAPAASAGLPTFRFITNSDLPNSGVSANTYNNVTVNSKGIVTGGSNVAYLTAESDTLQSVVGRGKTVSSDLAGATIAEFINTNATSGNGLYVKGGGQGGASGGYSLRVDSAGGSQRFVVDKDGHSTVAGNSYAAAFIVTGEASTGGTKFLKANGTLDTTTYLSSVPNLQSVCNVGSTTTTSITAGSFVKSGGASNEILKADGFVELETNYVKINNTQTISGLKTFSSQVNLSDSLFFDNFGITTGLWFRSSNINRLVIWYANNTAIIAAGTGVDVTVGGTNAIRVKATTGALECQSSVTATSFVKSGGTNAQFLKADGSVDSNTYLTSAITSVQFTETASGTTNSHSGPLAFVLKGTANQVIIGAPVSGNQYTLSLPQSINTGASVQFGSIGVGTAASGVAGEIRAIDNITAYYTSDERLKTNVRKIENALDKVTQINGVVYDWNDTYKKSHGDVDGYFVRDDNSGVIAQEVEKVFPNVVGERQDGFKAVRYELLVPLLIEAIKDLKAEIESLKAAAK